MLTWCYRGIRIRTKNHSATGIILMRVFSFHAQEYEGRFFLNPGTATGAWSGSFSQYVSNSPDLLSKELNLTVNSEAAPSFALMDIQGPIVTTYVYQLIEGEVRVEKIEYRFVNNFRNEQALISLQETTGSPSNDTKTTSTRCCSCIPSKGRYLVIY